MDTNGWAISPYEDLIDSRQVIDRIAELEAVADDDSNEPLDADELAELAALRALAAEASDYAADWEYGETLIADSYFKEYAQDLAEDCGMIPDDLSWPLDCIDWDMAADRLQMDYTPVEYAGRTFWVR